MWKLNEEKIPRYTVEKIARYIVYKQTGTLHQRQTVTVQYKRNLLTLSKVTMGLFYTYFLRLYKALAYISL